MKTKLSLKEAELYRRIDEVIFYIWDPIGVYDQPYARDEYYSYLPGIFDELIITNDKEKIIGPFIKASEYMGLTLDIDRTYEIIDILLLYKEKIFNE